MVGRSDNSKNDKFRSPSIGVCEPLRTPPTVVSPLLATSTPHAHFNRRRLAEPSDCSCSHATPIDFPDDAGPATPGPVHDSLISETSIRCRICLDVSRDDSFVQHPCGCRGTVGIVHTKCLQQWLTHSGTDHCEICGCRYQTEPTTPRIKDWIKGYLIGRHIFIDLVCFIILTTGTVAGLYYSVLLTLKYISSHQLQYRLALMMTTLSLIITVIYLLWLSCIIRYHIRSWREYVRGCKRIKLVSERTARGGTRQTISVV